MLPPAHVPSGATSTMAKCTKVQLVLYARSQRRLIQLSVGITVENQAARKNHDTAISRTVGNQVSEPTQHSKAFCTYCKRQTTALPQAGAVEQLHISTEAGAVGRLHISSHTPYTQPSRGQWHPHHAVMKAHQLALRYLQKLSVL